MHIKSIYWERVRLAKSGRPELINEDNIQENDILIQSHIGLYQGNFKLTQYQKGKVYLTNRRLIFVDSQQASAKYGLGLNLIDIDDIAIYNGFLKSSPKIILKMRRKSAKSISEGHSSRANGTSRLAFEVNWICPICSFSNLVKSNIQIKTDADVPCCKNCGMKPLRYLIEGVVQASTKQLTPANNVISKEGFQCPTCTFINDVSLKNCEMCGTRLVSSNLPPQLLTSDEDQQLQLEVETDDQQQVIDQQIIKLSFRKGGVKTFLDKLELARDQAIWEHMKGNAKVNVNAMDSLEMLKLNSDVVASTRDGPKFGIQGLQNKRELESFEKSILLNNSLQDLENLMEKAKDLIQLSSSYQKVLARDRLNNPQINATANILANSKNSINILNNIITKNEFVNNTTDSSLISSLRKKKGKDSSLYIEELARQLYEFLVDSDVISRNHGLITLFDLFIVYNRARGINLISPEELFKGVQLFEKLNFKYILFKVPLISKNISDIINSHRLGQSQETDDKFYIISNKNFTFSSILQKIIRFIDSQQLGKNIYYGLSIIEIQKNPKLKLNINFLILNQLLLDSCMDGKLCVDQGLQGSFFYKNEISAFNWDEYMLGNDREIEVLPHEPVFDFDNWRVPEDVEDTDNNEDVESRSDGVISPLQDIESNMNPPLEEFEFNYRLGGKRVEDDDDADLTYHRKFNGALEDLKDLQF